MELLLRKKASPLIKCSGVELLDWNDSIDGGGNEMSTPLCLAAATGRIER